MIITSLAILIAVAGYLNFADVDLGFKDKEASTDSSSILDQVEYDLTDETALLDENGAKAGEEELPGTGTPGEAVLTGASDFAAQAKLSREQIRSQNKAELQAIIGNADISEERKQEAINTMVSMTDLAEKEAAAELLLEAKGFSNVIVNLTGETADIVVPEADLEDARRAQIEDIVKRKTGIAAENIVITPLSQSSDEAAADETVDNPEESSLETTGTDAGSETSDTGEEAESSETEQTSGCLLYTSFRICLQEISGSCLNRRKLTMTDFMKSGFVQAGLCFSHMTKGNAFSGKREKRLIW